MLKNMRQIYEKHFQSMEKGEKMYVRHLLAGVQEYTLEHPSYSLEEIENVFGTPAEVVSSYWHELNLEELVQEVAPERQNTKTDLQWYHCCCCSVVSILWAVVIIYTEML